MGQTVFTNSDLVFTRIGNTTTAKVKRAQNADKNILNIPETCTIGNIQCTVVEIESQGFKQAHNLKKLTIPSTVTVIGNEAFQYCGELEEVNMGDNVTEIGDCAFQGCDDLTSINFPNTLTTIGANAFNSCNGLNTLYFPPNLTTIGDNAFKSSNHITLIYLCSDITSMGTEVFTGNGINVYVLGDINWPAGQEYPFGNVNNNARINVPCDQIDYYKGMFRNDWEKNLVTCVNIHTTKANGNFNTSSTWHNSIPGNDDFFVIDGHTVTLNQPLQVQPYKALNKGVLRIEGEGQLIDNGTGNTPALAE